MIEKGTEKARKKLLQNRFLETVICYELFRGISDDFLYKVKAALSRRIISEKAEKNLNETITNQPGLFNKVNKDNIYFPCKK